MLINNEYEVTVAVSDKFTVLLSTLIDTHKLERKSIINPQLDNIRLLNIPVSEIRTTRHKKWWFR